MSEANGGVIRADLPEGWEWKRLADVATVVGGSTPRSREPSYWGGDIPWLGVADLTGYDDMYIGRGARSITQTGYDSCTTQMVPSGTVLFSSRAPIGYVAIAANELCTSQGFKSFVPADEVTSEYLYWWLRHARAIAESLASGTTFKELSGKRAAEIPIPVPPLEEQGRIVERIEEVHATLNAGMRRLEEASSQLRPFRAASYAGAFSGGSRRLTQLGEERLETIATVQSGIAKGRRSIGEASEVPYLRTANVQAGFLDLAEVKMITVTPKQRTRHRLSAGDVLVLEGGDADKVGRGWLWEGQVAECLHQNHVFAVRPGDRLRPRFLAHYINAPSARAYFLSVAKQTTNLASINKTNLTGLPVPMFSLDDQDLLTDELDQKLASADHLGGAIDAARLRLDDLQRSAFHRAFQGKLPGLEDLPAVAERDRT